MSGGEDTKISVRSMKRRPVESLLLVIGIALGIGATAAGIAMYAKSVSDGRELLGNTEYREIVVSAREKAEDMENPVVENTDGEDIILTVSDLDAAEISSAVAHAYIANRIEIRLGSLGRIMQGMQPPDGRTRTAEAGAGAGAADGGNPEEFMRLMESIEIDGPEPMLDEIGGYEVTPEFFPAWNLEAAEGSVITQDDIDSGARVMVVGAGIGKTLFEDGVALGRQVQVFMDIVTIIGVLEPTGTPMDEMAFRPSTIADTRRFGGFGGFRGMNTSLHFVVEEPEDLDTAQRELESWFDEKYGDGVLSYSIPRNEARAAQKRSMKLSLIILVLALSGLLIANVNVSNILYSRALRRRKHVGILKALGASRRSIFGLFFKEGLLILAGGVFIGAGLTYLLSRIIGASLNGGALSILVAGAGVLGACAVTLAFTVLPAVQASRIPAAEAIRAE